ncbi:MAG: hypothetical protein [Circular genetic element sp.]|nr:MAG: hypothetical protein [Circular genetic element sp.]
MRRSENGFNLLYPVSQMWIYILWVLAMTCNVCLELIRLFGSAESVLPWYCKCELFTDQLVRKSKQKLITHQCECPVVTFRNTRRTMVYCRCE